MLLGPDVPVKERRVRLWKNTAAAYCAVGADAFRHGSATAQADVRRWKTHVWLGHGTCLPR